MINGPAKITLILSRASRENPNMLTNYWEDLILIQAESSNIILQEIGRN